MEMSETIASLAGALSKAQAKIEGAKKDSNNPHFKSKYADLASVWDACREALTSEGLSIAQMPGACASGQMEMTTMLMHSSGEWIRETLTIPLQKVDAQGYGSASTYARRYSLAAMVGVAPDDDDGNAASKPSGAENNAPSKREPAWTEGPYSGKSQLHAAMTRFTRDLESCGDLDTLEAFVASDEYKAFVNQAQTRAPHYLEGGDPAPPEFMGLFAIEQKMRDQFIMEGQ